MIMYKLQNRLENGECSTSVQWAMEEAVSVLDQRRRKKQDTKNI